MQYRTSKCPHCGYRLESRTPTGINDYSDQFGAPVIECPACKGKIRTRRQYWETMLPFDKFMAVVRMIFTILYQGVIVAIVLAVALDKIFGLDKKMNEAIFLVALIIVSLAITSFFNIRAFNNLKSIRPDE
jgi:DNA-directed RNA polymerase subunit RPC12/RpoP